MYCPSCLNNSLYIKDSGVIEILINEKKMDSGRFLFNKNGNKEEIVTEARKKFEEFIKWLSNFSNLEPVKKVKFVTGDVKCDSGCPSSFTKISAVGDVLSAAQVNNILSEMGEKYNMEFVLDA
ncbi:MAG: hypothetical protein CME70_04655 [Halobacteriovorax sp.]|nr:hypothetical protein [Halobacteriovorax sp.]|tara:strand:- start:75134 stop:75502 length:369 start_codon:yes stop_codon:yes gene_type:complete